MNIKSDYNSFLSYLLENDPSLEKFKNAKTTEEFSELFSNLDFSKSSIWPYIMICNREKGTLWKDVEYQMSNFLFEKRKKNRMSLEAINDYTYERVLYPAHDDNIYFQDTDKRIKLLTTKIFVDYIANKVVPLDYHEMDDINFEATNLKLISNLKKQLILLEEKFQCYMNLIIPSQNQYKNNATKKLFEILSIGNSKSTLDYKEVVILNFNYTSILLQNNKEQNLENVYTINSWLTCKERNIHGRLAINNQDCNIIFGIDSNMVDSKDSKFKFTKTFRVINKDITSKLSTKTDIPEEIKYLYFYGHSLGEQDYSYFQSIFDSINLYSGKTILRFVYNDRYELDPIKKEKITDDMNTNVGKLLQAYGESFEQEKTKGKNLLHRLILENRLEIFNLDQ